MSLCLSFSFCVSDSLCFRVWLCVFACVFVSLPPCLCDWVSGCEFLWLSLRFECLTLCVCISDCVFVCVFYLFLTVPVGLSIYFHVSVSVVVFCLLDSLCLCLWFRFFAFFVSIPPCYVAERLFVSVYVFCLYDSVLLCVLFVCFLSLSHHACVTGCLFACLCVCVFSCLTVFIWLCVFVFLFQRSCMKKRLFACLSVCLCVFFVSDSLCSYVWLSFFLFLSLSHCAFVTLCVFSFFLCFFLSFWLSAVVCLTLFFMWIFFISLQRAFVTERLFACLCVCFCVCFISGLVMIFMNSSGFLAAGCGFLCVGLDFRGYPWFPKLGHDLYDFALIYRAWYWCVWFDLGFYMLWEQELI